LTNPVTPWHVDKLPTVTTKERKPKPPTEGQQSMAKPKGIERKGERYKVTLDIQGKKCHIAYCKTLEAAKEALEKAKRESGVYDE